MKNALLLLGITLIVTLSGPKVMGQTATNNLSLGMPEVLLVKSNASSINLTLSPQEAGLAVQPSLSDSTARVLISSVVSGEQTRTLTASVTSGSVPAGTYLKLVALSPNASFVGTAGTLGAQVELGAVAQTIVSAIGTCYSGTAADDGYGLKYTFGIPAASGTYGSIRATAGAAVTVTLTLSAGS
ncbi:MAG: hypothetical protein A2X18_08020 [Bacteroidetes bacterium GWF2_40_14]|nr:MAG: hypothetical protein A2X18_08020 [Bacteroidetes bacterium GWF2_40_14]